MEQNLQDVMDMMSLWIEGNPEQFEKDWNEQFKKPNNMNNLSQWPKINNDLDEKKSGFFPLKGYKEKCDDPRHDPPSHIVIPQGQGYRHVCPSCGQEVVIIPTQYSL